MNAGFTDYQIRCRDTAVYGEAIDKQVDALACGNQEAANVLRMVRRVDYCAVGLAGEAGEVANQVKKITRDDGGELTDDRRMKLIQEIGGVMWYIAQLCTELRLDMGAVAAANLDELRARAQQNTIHGDRRV